MTRGEQRPQASATVELNMSEKDHRVLTQELISVAGQLEAREVPSSYDVTYGGINLAGDTPLTFSAGYHREFNRMSFETAKGSRLTDEPKVTIWLGSKHPDQHLSIRAEPMAVTRGRNKQFLIYPHGSTMPKGAVKMDDLGILLDGILPTPNQFGVLTDPRSDSSFNSITLGMRALLKPRATTVKSALTYTVKDHMFSHIEVAGYVAQYANTSGCHLTVTTLNGVDSYTLMSTAPVDIEGGRVFEQYGYKFSSSRERAPSNPVGFLALKSVDIPRTDLLTLAEYGRSNTNSFSVGQRAVRLFLQQLDLG